MLSKSSIKLFLFLVLILASLSYIQFAVEALRDYRGLYGPKGTRYEVCRFKRFKLQSCTECCQKNGSQMDPYGSDIQKNCVCFDAPHFAAYGKGAKRLLAGEIGYDQGAAGFYDEFKHGGGPYRHTDHYADPRRHDQYNHYGRYNKHHRHGSHHRHPPVGYVEGGLHSGLYGGYHDLHHGAHHVGHHGAHHGGYHGAHHDLHHGAHHGGYHGAHHDLHHGAHHDLHHGAHLGGYHEDIHVAKFGRGPGITSVSTSASSGAATATASGGSVSATAAVASAPKVKHVSQMPPMPEHGYLKKSFRRRKNHRDGYGSGDSSSSDSESDSDFYSSHYNRQYGPEPTYH